MLHGLGFLRSLCLRSCVPMRVLQQKQGAGETSRLPFPAEGHIPLEKNGRWVPKSGKAKSAQAGGTPWSITLQSIHQHLACANKSQWWSEIVGGIWSETVCIIPCQSQAKVEALRSSPQKRSHPQPQGSREIQPPSMGLDSQQGTSSPGERRGEEGRRDPPAAPSRSP